MAKLDHIRIRQDGYISASDIFYGDKSLGDKSLGDKSLDSYYQHDSTRAFINALSISTGIKAGRLINIKDDGAWVHPDIAIDIAQWVSVAFKVKVMTWISEWRKQTLFNQLEFTNALNNMSSDQATLSPQEVRKRLMCDIYGTQEVICDAGCIDILTDTAIIDIKHVDDWKSAIGCVLAYGSYYPEHKKIIHLFGTSADKSIIAKHCTFLGIYVEFECDFN